MATPRPEKRQAQVEFDAAWKAVDDFAGDQLATRLVEATRALDRALEADRLRAQARDEPILP